MKSIANQYRDLKEGKMSQSNFMRNVRMMMPQYITNVTSFKDAVRILKNKAILTELHEGNDQWIEEDLPGMAGGMHGSEDFRKAMGIEDDSPYEDDDEDGEIEDMIAKAAEEESGKYTKFQDFEGGLGESMTDPDSEEFTLAVEDYLDSDKWGLTPEQEKEALIYLEDNYYDLQGDFANNHDVDGGAYAAAKYIVSVVKSMDEGFYGWDDPSDKTSYDLERLHDYINQKYQKESGEEMPYEAFEEIDAYFRTPEFKKDKNYYFDNSEGLIDHILDKFVRNRSESEDLQENKKENYDKGDLVKYKNFPQGSVKTGKVVKDLGDKVVIFHKEDGVEHTISKDKLVEAKKKKEAKAELHPNQIHPQELRMGIKVELEHTDDLDKAKKIALDHLAENPFYYTALKLSGIESPSAPKVKAPEEKKAKKKKEAVELVDKANQMVKVKDTKKKLNEAGGEFMFSGTLNNVEAEELRKIIPGVEIEEEELEDTYKTVISHPTYNEKSLRHAVKQAMGQLPPVGDKKDLGASFDKFKSSLEEVVREVIAEYYDGRDNLDAENEY